MTGETLGAFTLCWQLSDDFRNKPPGAPVWQSREGTEDSGFVKTCTKIHVLCLPLGVLHMCCHASGAVTDTQHFRNSDMAFLQRQNLMGWPLLFSTKHQNPFPPHFSLLQLSAKCYWVQLFHTGMLLSGIIPMYLNERKSACVCNQQGSIP